MILSILLDQSRPLNTTQQGLMIAVFLGLNLSLNMIGKYVLGTYGFRFAVTLTISHLAFGFFAVLPVMTLPRFREMHRVALARQWKGILAVGSFIGLNIVLNNLSLVYIELTLNQIIRSGIPVFTAALGVVVEKKMPTRVEMVGILVLTAGVVTCLYEGSSVDGSLKGILLCLASTLCGAAMLSFSGAVLDQTEKMDPVRLNFYSAPVAIAEYLTLPSAISIYDTVQHHSNNLLWQVLTPAFLMLEAKPLRVWWDSHTHEVVIYILAGAAIAVLYNIVHSLVIQRTSAVTTPVIGMIKVVAIIILSAIILGERDVYSVKMTSGCALSILGGYLYSQAKVSSSKGAAQSHAATPVTSSMGWNKPLKSSANGIVKDFLITHGRREHSPSRRRPESSSEAV